MRLTEKDKEFLSLLRRLIESKDLWVDRRPGRPSYMVLRGTYGEEVHKAFRMSRQGVRWRFQRLFNGVYVSAFETILFIERIFGRQLREHALRISRERYSLYQQAALDSFRDARAPRQSAGRETNKGSRQATGGANHADDHQG